MSVSTLAGTTWLINENPTYSPLTGLEYSFFINFTSNNTEFQLFYPSTGRGTSYANLNYWITTSSPSVKISPYNGSTWTDQAYRTITITGGTDVTNSTLIAWFEANATQIITSNDPYLTTGFDLASIADAIRNKTWGTSDLTFPSQYISSISNLPVGNIESSRSVVYNTPGSATITPSSGYVGFESAYIEFSPNVWDGQYTWTPAPVIIEFTIQGTTYEAEEGMTWGEWVESEYNTINAYAQYGQVFLTAIMRVGGEGETYVSTTSIIIENGTYYPQSGGAN